MDKHAQSWYMRTLGSGASAARGWCLPDLNRNPEERRAGSRSRQQCRPGPQGAEEEDAARGDFPRDEAPRPLRKTLREEGAREGGSDPPGAQAGAQARAARRALAQQAQAPGPSRRPPLTIACGPDPGPLQPHPTTADTADLLDLLAGVGYRRGSGKRKKLLHRLDCPAAVEIAVARVRKPAELLRPRDEREDLFSQRSP